MSHIPQAQETDVVHTSGRVLVDSRGEAAKAIHILGSRVSAVRSIASAKTTKVPAGECTTSVDEPHEFGWDGIGNLADRDPIICHIDPLPTTRGLRTHVADHVVHDNGTLPAPA